ncbi:MAG: threonine--tRNA ligase [Deferribacterota bacterium]|nr:threonine--tRNA ligase [Deferribacterota bacterium]
MIVYIDKKEFNIKDNIFKVNELLSYLNINSKSIIAVSINGVYKDLDSDIGDGDKIELISAENEKAIEILRHSAAHLMAQAVKRLFSNAKLVIGPPIENGFYYDIDLDINLSEKDLPLIEKEMDNIVQSDYKIIREELPKEEAIELFGKIGETYKIELLKDINDEFVSIYRQGEFVDLCRGPHVPSTGYIKHYKLLKVAGAYLRGDSRNKMLQRIYGTAFFKKNDLTIYLNRLKEAEKRDHRKLGRQLNIFLIDEKVGAGLPIYLPKGGLLRGTLEEFEKSEHLKRGYQIVYGPTILKKELWKQSGHLENYSDSMYFTEVDGVSYGIKPMNCLNHIIIYKSDIRSYRDLPLKYFELGTVHRNEKSGVLHGLLRVRSFTQDDAHIFCREDQLTNEIHKVIDFIDYVMGVFGFSYTFTISTKPEKYIGSDEVWDISTKSLFDALDNRGLTYNVAEGDGAFYGPKIDVTLTDALGRKWQCATIQCDLNLPDRFDLKYIGKEGKEHRPVMIHRVILGSLDRFIGILIEHFAGLIPFWLAPVQIIILTIADRHISYARELADRLMEDGFRIELDIRNEKIGYKIRQAVDQKIPHIIIVGDKEIENRSISVRIPKGVQINDLKLQEYKDNVEFLRREKKLDFWR